MNRTEKDFQHLSFLAGAVSCCDNVEGARDVILQILKWAGYTIDAEALARFDDAVLYTETNQTTAP